VWQERRLVMEILALAIGAVMLDIAAFLWGADSRDGAGSDEWGRRAAWRAA
jgi:hypothetical protein